MQKLTVGSLFSGIGGLELGLEMTGGFETKWQCEIDEYATKVLEKHWPNVPKYRDIRDCGKYNLERTDVLVGGFPCQDISNAGKKAGIKEGTRSGLWSEYYRIICELQPRYVLVENVSALRNRGMGRVLGDLAEAGYNAEWKCLRASDFNAPHRRERLFIVAYTCKRGLPLFISETWLHTPNTPLCWQSFRTTDKRVWLTPYCIPSRNHDGIPSRVDRFRVVGNAVVPQVACHVGHAILNHAAMSIMPVEQELRAA